VGIEQMDAEVVETVAGVVRLLRRAAELAWTQADASGPRSSHQLLALGIDAAADEASGLLPRRARLDGPTSVGDNPAELLASAEQLLRRICVVGAPTRLLGLRVMVAELVWRRIPVPARDQRTVGELWQIAMRFPVTPFSMSPPPRSGNGEGVGPCRPVSGSIVVLPPVSLAAQSGPDLMVRLRGLGEEIARSTAGHWPGPGPQDQRLLEIARNLSHARDLVERYGRDVEPTGAEARADIADARARVMHTLYGGAHGTAVALRDYANDLRDRLRVDTRRAPARRIAAGGSRDPGGGGHGLPLRSLRAACGRLWVSPPSHGQRSWRGSANPSTIAAGVGVDGLGHPCPPHTCHKPRCRGPRADRTCPRRLSRAPPQW
jgi:hypothetical protein